MRIAAIGLNERDRHAVFVAAEQLGHTVLQFRDDLEAVATGSRLSETTVLFVADDGRTTIPERLIEAQRSTSHLRDVQFVVVVGRPDGNRHDVMRAFKLGADDFMPSPLADLPMLGRLAMFERLAASHVRLVELASVDELSGLLNRRAFYTAVDSELQNRAQDGCSASVTILDVDKFKRINDHHGHFAGDAVIRELGGRLRRQAGISARLGGDEFVFFTLAESLSANEVRLRELRSEVSELRVTGFADVVSATVSLGTAYFDPAAERNLSPFMKQADETLYRNKRNSSAIEGRHLKPARPSINWSADRLSPDI